MNRLALIPLWFWYIFSVLYCYFLWNPYYSIFDLAQGTLDPALKAIFIIVALIIGSLYLVEGHRSLNAFGIALFFALVGAILWLAMRHGASLSGADLWGQWIVGALLTIALQGGRIYRSLTGRVPVGTGSTDDTGHHHS